MNTEGGRNKEEVDNILVHLRDTMAREVTVMREMLSNLQAEQQAILINDTEHLNTTLKARESLMDILLECRRHRCDGMRDVATIEGLSSPLSGDLSAATLDILYSHDSAESCEILSLRDQLVALIDGMRRQAERNNYLIHNKVALTKEMIRRLYPGSDNNTYGKDGTVGQKRCTVAIINQEV